MDTMVNVWSVVEQVRVASSAVELVIFTAILYWFFTSSRVADMLEVVGERVGGWCGRDSSGSLRQAVRARRRHQQSDIYSKLDAEYVTRSATLYRVKEGPVVPAPQPPIRPPAGLACSRCAPISRESWHDPKVPDTGAVINIMDIGKQNFANGGMVSRYLCDLAQCINLINYEYKDVAPQVEKDERFLKAIEDATQEELRKLREMQHSGGGEGGSTPDYSSVRKQVEAKAKKVLQNISSAMSNNVLRFVAWVCHKAVRRLAGGGCGTRLASVRRLRRALAAGVPLVLVPLHRSHLDYILLTFSLYLTGLRPPLVAAGDNMRIPLFGWFLRGCGAFFIRRRVNGSEYHGDPIYKSALRAYILNSLAEKNNLEFFIEGGRTRTGKPQSPKAGILSVIMDAYLDGTIDDALLVPATLNYEKLVDGNFVREQLGMPKQMETFWSALRGIWHTLNTNHGSIRVDFNQPISLKELVQSFEKCNFLKAPSELPTFDGDADLASTLDRKILYNHSHSSLYGADVGVDHKMMVEAIARHLVYDASQATALMITNVVAYVLLTEQRAGGSLLELERAVARRGSALAVAGHDLGYAGEIRVCVARALDMLGRELIKREGSGDKQIVKPYLSIAASLELSYYANAVVVQYAAPAILATALESLIRSPDAAGRDVIRHSELMEAALQLCEILNQEFILCPPCHRIEETMLDAINDLIVADIIINEQKDLGIEEQQWSRRFARTLEEDDEEEYRPDPTAMLKYTVSSQQHALEERRRLVVSLRPLLEAYAATCRCLRSLNAETAQSAQNTPLKQREFVTSTIQTLSDDFTQNRMLFGEAVSSDAIHNCLRLLKQWGVIQLYTDNRDRKLRLCPSYEDLNQLDIICAKIYKFNMETPLLQFV